MPQESTVLCCYSCEMFQTSLVKKSKKWQCKVCGEKQSIKKVYYEGSGKDCRGHVQMLNSKRQSKQQLETETLENMVTVMKNSFIDSIKEEMPETVITGSKWAKYSNHGRNSEDTEFGAGGCYDAQTESKFHVDTSASKNKPYHPSSSSKRVKRDEFFSKKTAQCKINSPVNESSHINIKKRNSHDHDYNEDDEIEMNIRNKCNSKSFKKVKMENSGFSGDSEKDSGNRNIQYEVNFNTETVLVDASTACNKNEGEDDFRRINIPSKSLKSCDRKSLQDSNFTCVDEKDSPEGAFEYSQSKSKKQPSNFYGDIEDDFLVNDLGSGQTETEADYKINDVSASMVQNMENVREEVPKSHQTKIEENIDPNTQNSGSIISDRSKLSFVEHKPELDFRCNVDLNKKSIFENDDDLDDLLDF